MLTPEQEEIVYTQHRLCKVLSAAGSGKTTVLTARIEQLVRNGVDPKSILAITFTRRAGKELLGRLSPACQEATVGTFHSTILKVMQDKGICPNVLDENEADATLDRCAAQVGWMVGSKYKSGRSRNKCRELVRKARMGEASDYANLYMSELNLNGDIDFDGILATGVSMAREGYFDWVHYLFVDETQDNEPLQWDFVNEISSRSHTLVVGDVGQSLYSFRGAVPEHFQNLDWPELQMQQSWRFPSNIADIANSMNATPLHIVSHKPAVDVGVHKVVDIADFAKWLLDTAQPEEIAILCRYNNEVENIRLDLQAAGVPVVVPSIRINGPLHDLLMYLASPLSTTSREKVKSWIGTRPKLVEYIASTLSHNSCLQMVANWMHGEKTVGDILRKLSDDLDAYHNPELQYLIKEFGSYTPQQYKSEMSEPQWLAEGRGVTVGTVHWSKGGEWPVVVLAYLEENQWPRRSSLEETRVLYVAATRTMDKLHVLHKGNPSEFVRYFNLP